MLEKFDETKAMLLTAAIGAFAVVFGNPLLAHEDTTEQAYYEFSGPTVDDVTIPGICCQPQNRQLVRVAAKERTQSRPDSL